MSDSTPSTSAQPAHTGLLATCLHLAYLLRPTKSDLRDFGWYIVGFLGAAISCWVNSQHTAADGAFAAVIVMSVLWSIGYACSRPSDADDANVP